MWNIEYSFCQIYKPHTWFCLPNINHCETITSISISWSETAFNLQFHINTWAVVGSNEVQILHYCTWIEFLVNCTLSIFFSYNFFTFTPQSFAHKSLLSTLHFLNSLVPLGLKLFREVTDYFALLRVFKHQSNSNLNVTHFVCKLIIDDGESCLKNRTPVAEVRCLYCETSCRYTTLVLF